MYNTRREWRVIHPCTAIALYKMDTLVSSFPPSLFFPTLKSKVMMSMEIIAFLAKFCRVPVRNA